MVWQRNRAMMGFTCTKCHKEVHWDEWDDDEEMCLYCVFPETSPIRPAEYNKDLGYDRNQTEMGYVMENLKEIPVNKRNDPLDSRDKKLLKTIRSKKPKTI